MKAIASPKSATFVFHESQFNVVRKAYPEPGFIDERIPVTALKRSQVNNEAATSRKKCTYRVTYFGTDILQFNNAI